MKMLTYVGVGLLCAGMASATIIVPTSVTFTGTATELGGLNLDDENNIINGSGLSEALTDANIGTVTHSGVTFDAPGNAWVTNDPGGFPSDYFDSTSDTIIFEIDLGGTTSVGTFASWGYHFGAFNGNSVSDVTLEFSTNSGGSYDSSQTIVVPLGATFDGSTVVPLSPVSANYIKLTVNDNHFGNATGGDRVGIAEIAFSTIVIPEPSTLSLIAVFGGIVMLCRRKRSA